MKLKVDSSVGIMLMLGVKAAAAGVPLYKTSLEIPGVGRVQGTAAVTGNETASVKGGEGISFFGNIPYGADTSGENRWRAPQPAAVWNNTLNATSFGPICPQDNPALEIYTMSEDCLSLNIWTPATSSDEKLPVAIWSYGAGTAPPQSAYNGAGIAAKGIIFVSYNYRAGIFGFLANPDLSETNASTTASGNWGILDQFAAVKWVHENIAAFGGDPDHITVMGQSFGSGATYHIVNSPLTTDLGIVNAICESGVTWPSDPYTGEQANAYINQSAANAAGTEAFSALNVSSVAEARALSYDSVLSGTSALTMSFLPVLDFYAIPDTYSNTLLETGAGNKVPFLAGFNADESGASSTLNVTVAQYQTFVEGFYGNQASEILKLYPSDNDSQASVSQSDLVREHFRVSTWLFMNAFSKSGNNVSTYTYYWNHSPPGGEGASHGSEIVYVLGNLWAQSDVGYTAADYHISEVMSEYWANFIKTGNPNHSEYTQSLVSLPADWNAASAEAMQVFQVGQDFRMIPVAGTAKVEVFEAFFSALTPY